MFMIWQALEIKVLKKILEPIPCSMNQTDIYTEFT